MEFTKFCFFPGLAESDPNKNGIFQDLAKINPNLFLEIKTIWKRRKELLVTVILKKIFFAFSGSFVCILVERRIYP